MDFKVTGSGSYADPLFWFLSGVMQRDGTQGTSVPDVFNFSGHLSSDGSGNITLGRSQDVVLRSAKALTLSADYDANSTGDESRLHFAADATRFTTMRETGFWDYGVAQASSAGDIGRISWSGDNWVFSPSNGSGGLDFAAQMFYDVAATAWTFETPVIATGFNVGANAVVGAQGAALSVDATDLATALTLVNEMKARLKAHGLVAT